MKRKTILLACLFSLVLCQGCSHYAPTSKIMPKSGFLGDVEYSVVSEQTRNGFFVFDIQYKTNITSAVDVYIFNLSGAEGTFGVYHAAGIASTTGCDPAKVESGFSKINRYRIHYSGNGPLKISNWLVRPTQNRTSDCPYNEGHN